jgi:hypothetical protein
MKVFVLKFNDEEKAKEILIPLGFGYVSNKRGPILLNNILGKFILQKVKSETGYVVRITLNEEATPELEQSLEEYKM